MNIVNILASPVVGSVIGYFTNYIAVKMLFRPLNPVKIGSFTLPFTPGIIPKRKAELGKAIGNTIGNTLFTKDDLTKIFLSEEIKSAVTDKIMLKINAVKDNSLKEIFQNLVNEARYSELKEKLVEFVTLKLINNAEKINLGKIIASEAGKAVKEKLQGNIMLAVLVNDKLIDSFTEPMAEQINSYISENGNDLLIPLVANEISVLEEKQISAILSSVNFSDDTFKNTFSKLYDKLVEENLGNIIQNININSIVEEKINAMNVMEIEKMVLSVMKNELDSIVNLGAVIGFLIGIINIFI